MYRDTFNYKNGPHLLEILGKNELIQEILRRVPQLVLPNWYLAAGCLAQTVWNYYHGYALSEHIKDYDLIYFDNDTAAEKEKKIKRQGLELFADLKIKVDIVNQARVHLWYKERFGYSIKPYCSVEQALNTWPVTATCVGITSKEDTFKVSTPHGLDDLFSMIIRANNIWLTDSLPCDKRHNAHELYFQKVSRWKTVWPKLVVLPWV